MASRQQGPRTISKKENFLFFPPRQNSQENHIDRRMSGFTAVTFHFLISSSLSSRNPVVLSLPNTHTVIFAPRGNTRLIDDSATKSKFLIGYFFSLLYSWVLCTEAAAQGRLFAPRLEGGRLHGGKTQYGPVCLSLLSWPTLIRTISFPLWRFPTTR